MTLCNGKCFTSKRLLKEVCFIDIFLKDMVHQGLQDALLYINSLMVFITFSFDSVGMEKLVLFLMELVNGMYLIKQVVFKRDLYH